MACKIFVSLQEGFRGPRKLLSQLYIIIASSTSAQLTRLCLRPTTLLPKFNFRFLDYVTYYFRYDLG